MTVDDDAPSSVPVDLVVAVDIHRNAATVGNVDARDATRNPAAAAGAPAIVHGWTRHVASSRTSNASTAARSAGTYASVGGELGTGSAPKWVATTATVGDFPGTSGARAGDTNRHARRPSPKSSPAGSIATRTVPTRASGPRCVAGKPASRPKPPVVAAVTATPPSAIVAEGFTPVAAGGSATVTAIPPESVDSPSPNPSASATATIRVGVRGIVAGVSHRRIADETKTPGAGSAAAEPPARSSSVHPHSTSSPGEASRALRGSISRPARVTGSPRDHRPGPRAARTSPGGEVDDGVVGVEKSRVDAPVAADADAEEAVRHAGGRGAREHPGRVDARGGDAGGTLDAGEDARHAARRAEVGVLGVGGLVVQRVEHAPGVEVESDDGDGRARDRGGGGGEERRGEEVLAGARRRGARGREHHGQGQRDRPR